MEDDLTVVHFLMTSSILCITIMSLLLVYGSKVMHEHGFEIKNIKFMKGVRINGRKYNRNHE